MTVKLALKMKREEEHPSQITGIKTMHQTVNCSLHGELKQLSIKAAVKYLWQ